MRNLRRNCQTVYFREYLGETEILDEYGEPTGSVESGYGELKSATLYVSANKGGVEYSPFGGLEDYDRVMSTSDPLCPITEHCVLWVDGVDTDSPYNYTVRKVSRWKNSTSYAIRQVTVDE